MLNILAHNSYYYQHINIIRGMSNLSDKKIQLKFRYQIQFTNEILDNDFFLPSQQPENHFWKDQRQRNQSVGLQKMDIEYQKTKNQRKKLGKERPVILVSNPHTLGSSIGRMEQQIQAINPEPEHKEPMNPSNRISTPKKQKGNANSSLLTTAQKKTNGSEQQLTKRKNSRKGLAWISEHILELLEGQYSQEKKFTCGEISDRVLTDFYTKTKQKLKDSAIEEKEKKTIRRRVYDSINVLIALGKIKKDHKFLYVESIDRKIGEEIVAVKREKLASIMRDAERKQTFLSKAKEEYSKLLQLKSRNEELSESKQQGYSGTFSTFSPAHSIYKFPLLFVYGQGSSKMHISFESDNASDQEGPVEKIILTSNPLNLLSDLSSLQYLTFSESRSNIRKDSKKNGS